MTKYFHKNISAPVKASFWFMVANFMQQGISVITAPIFTRVLTTSDYGVTSVYYSWAALLSVIVTLSLTAGVYNNGMLDFKNDVDGFTSSLLTLSSCSSVFFYIIYLIFNHQIGNMIQLSPVLINAMFLSFLLNPALSFWQAKQRFNYRYKLCITITMLTSVLSPILSYLAVIHFTSEKATAKILAGLGVILSVNAVIYIYLLLKGKIFVNLKYWKYALAFNLPLIPHYLAQIALSQVDRIMISNMIGTSQAGIYNIGYTAASVVSIIWTSINASWVPWTLKRMQDQKYSDIYKMTNPILLFNAAACAGLVAFSPEIIKVLAPPSYYQAIYVVPPVVMGIFFTFVYTLFSNIEYFHKKTFFVMVASVSAAVLNIVLNLLLLPVSGYIAAAYTTMAGYAVLCLLHYIFMKKIDKNKIYNIRFIVIISLSLMLFSALLMSFYNMVAIRYCIIAGICIAMFLFRKRLIENYKAIRS